jgi:hypothetical protein
MTKKTKKAQKYFGSPKNSSTFAAGFAQKTTERPKTVFERLKNNRCSTSENCTEANRGFGRE